MDYKTALEHVVLTSNESFLGGTAITSHFATESGCLIDTVYSEFRFSIFAWNDSGLIDSTCIEFPDTDYIRQTFAQFVTLYGVPLFS